MSGKQAKKVRKEVRETAKREFAELNQFLLDKDWKYRFRMAYRVLFPTKKVVL